MMEYETILVATDLSEPSRPALRHAATLAEKLGSRLVLAYVLEARLPAVVIAQSAESSDEIAERHRQQARRALEKMAAEELAGHEVDLVVREGPVHRAILELAEQRAADLIVIGMHGHGFLSHALTGSTAERVMHHAPCPVLVVGHAHDV